MRKTRCGLLAAVLMILSATPTAKAQTFNPFILSGRADRLAVGDLSFLTPELKERRVEAAVSYGRWLPDDLSYGALQAGVFFAANERFGLRMDFRDNRFAAFDAIDGQGNVSGTIQPSEQRLLAGISVLAAEALYLDINAKYLSASMGSSARDETARAFAGDIAVRYAKDGLTLGLKGADLGSSYRFGSNGASPLPACILAGGSYCLTIADKHAVTAGADLGYILPKAYGAFTAAVGAAYAFDRMLYARAGFQYSSAVAPRYAAFGAGSLVKGVGIDAAWIIGPAADAWTVGLKFAL